jgi:hypothetical protein
MFALSCGMLTWRKRWLCTRVVWMMPSTSKSNYDAYKGEALAATWAIKTLHI